MRIRYTGTVDIVGGTHDVGGLPSGGAGIVKMKTAQLGVRSSAGRPVVGRSKFWNPALPNVRYLQARQKVGSL